MMAGPMNRPTTPTNRATTTNVRLFWRSAVKDGARTLLCAIGPHIDRPRSGEGPDSVSEPLAVDACAVSHRAPSTSHQLQAAGADDRLAPRVTPGNVPARLRSQRLTPCRNAPNWTRTKFSTRSPIGERDRSVTGKRSAGSTLKTEASSGYGSAGGPGPP